MVLGEVDQSLVSAGARDTWMRAAGMKQSCFAHKASMYSCQTGPGFFFPSSNFSLLEKSVLVRIAEQTLPQAAIPREFVLIQINEHKAI